MTDIPDYIGQEAVRIINEECGTQTFRWPEDAAYTVVIATARALMMAPPEPPPEPPRDPFEDEALETWIAARGAWTLGNCDREAAAAVIAAKFREIAERSK